MPDRPAPIPPEVYARRRDRIFAALGTGALVLPGAPIRYRSRDAEYPHRPDSELAWTTGLTESGTVAVLRGHADGARLVLFTRPRDPTAELWAGPRLGPEGAKEHTGADEAYPIGELASRLPGLLGGADRVLFRLGEHPTVEPAVLRALAAARHKGARTGSGPRSVADPGTVLDDLRLIKDEHELARMRRAAELTAAGFRALARACRVGAGEWELQAALEAGFRAGGGDGPAFETIVASGPNACVLHYVALERRLAAGELVLVDAGAAFGLYAADLSRTFPVAGTWSAEGRAIYEIVEAARKAAVEAVRPGATVDEVHRVALTTLAAGLADLGLAARLPEPDEDGAYEPPAWYPHRTSHWLGLDVHDPGDYARDGQSRPLAPGMVLTVEPGLYLGPAAMEVLGEAARGWEGIGVRIEDDLLITPQGSEILTPHIPTDPDEVAALVG